MQFNQNVVFKLIVLGLVIDISSSAGTGCTFNVTNSETEKNLPIPLYNRSSEYELVIPQKGLIHLRPDQNLSLSCSGNRNYVRQTNSNVTTVTCIKDDQVKLYRKTYKFEEIQCKNYVKGDVRATEERCGSRQGWLYQIGYQVTRKEWVTLISVCYQPSIGNTLYTHHVIYGDQIKYASKTKYRPPFLTTGQYDNITSNLAYQKTFQKATFSNILGSSTLANEYINDKSFLARGHLSPDKDFLLATTQFSTYYYINAAPQWQSVNGASWKSIEYTVKYLAEYYGDLNIFTGTHGILRYRDINNNPQNMYLGYPDFLPVPQYFWKVVFEPKTSTSIVFIILNDPFVKSVREEIFCNDICNENGYNKKTWSDPSSGFVFCCEYDDFHKVVKTMPKIRVSGVLKEPSLNSEPSYKRYRMAGQ